MIQLSKPLHLLSDQELDERLRQNLIELSEKDHYRDRRRNLVKEISDIHKLMIQRAMQEGYRNGWEASGAGR